MKKYSKYTYIYCWFLLLFATACSSQKAAKTAAVIPQFPKDYIGNWSGVLEIYSPKGKVQEVPMQLNIQPLKDSTSTQYSWEIIYGEKAKDHRPYRLVPVDAEKGHWLVDENDGIQLDCFYLGGTLYSQFSVQGNMLTCTDRLDGDRLYYEITTSKTQALKTTGGTSSDVPPVDSYKIPSTQRAVLTRRK
jgi:hypothetical protein